MRNSRSTTPGERGRSAGLLLPVLLGAVFFLPSGCSDEKGTAPPADATPPDAVTDLRAAAVTETTIVLAWTAPGDDGAAGTAAAYDVRSSTTLIDAAVWDGLDPLPQAPSPSPAGAAESLVVTGLDPNVTYYFALRTADDAANASSLSNVLEQATRAGFMTFTLRADGTGDLPDLQSAVDASQDGDVIELEDGVYRGDGNRDVQFFGRSITVRAKSGLPDGCIIDCEGSKEAPHRGFLFRSGEGPEAVLEAFTIINGFESTEPSIAEAHDLSGGGVKIQQSAPTIRGLVIRRCHSEFTGGGISVEIGSDPLVVDCVFSENSASQQGGGVTVEIASSPVLRNCVITDNTAQIGGGIGITGGNSDPTIEDCLIAGNQAVFGGGIYIVGGAPAVSRCTIADNRANQNGGGLFLVQSPLALFERTILWGSCALGVGDGIFVDNLSTLRFDCCDVDSAGAGGSGSPEYETTIFTDPLFCDPGSCGSPGVDYGLEDGSPCLPDASPCGERIGVMPGGCGGR